MKGSRGDGALYYKAWAQNKAGQRAEALATIAVLAKEYPKSRYLTEAKALEAEVRRSSGQPVRPEGRKRRRAETPGHRSIAELRPGAGRADAREASPGPGLAQGQVAGALRARAERLAPRPRGPQEHRQGDFDAGPAEQGHRLSRDARRPRKPRRACRDLRRDAGRRCETPHPEGVHGRGREGPAVERRAERAERRPPRRSGPAARRHGRARRAVAALSEGNRRRTSRNESFRRCSSAAMRRG